MVDVISWESVAAVGALGTAAFGIVDGLKWTRFGSAGFGEVRRHMDKYTAVLVAAFGPDAWTLLESQYRNGRTNGELPRSLRQAVRIGLRPENSDQVCAALGGAVTPQQLNAAATAVQAGQVLSDTDRQVIARYEMAVDARIDGALGAAESYFVGASRVLAMAVALGLAIAAAFLLRQNFGDVDDFTLFSMAILIGLAAVPIAPIAKDLASGLTAAVSALRRK